MVVAANFTENIHGITFARLVLGEAVDNHLTLNAQALIVDATATAHREHGVQAQISAGYGCCAGGVANAHLAGIEQVVALIDAHIGHLDAHLQCGLRLLPGHGRSLGKVICAPGHLLLVNMVHSAQIEGCACVAHKYIGLGMACQYRSTGRAALVAINHLLGYLLRIGANTIFSDAVVTAHQHHGTFELGGHATGHGSKLLHHLLQLAQILAGLIDAAPASTHAGSCLLIQGRDYNFFHYIYSS